MTNEKLGHLLKLPIDEVEELVDAEPRVPYTDIEICEVLDDLYHAVETRDYISATPTKENPALSDDYIFDSNDERLILKDLTRENLVGKIKDLSKGAVNRRKRGYPDEYLYVFKYACKLWRRDAEISGEVTEDILIYIKLNNRKIPNKKVIIISFHKNRSKNKKRIHVF